MPVAGPSKADIAFHVRFHGLREVGKIALDLTKDPDFPEFLAVVNLSKADPDDSDTVRLASAFQQPAAEVEGEELLRKAAGPSGRTALYRIGEKTVWQYTDVRVKHAENVLGRMGVVDILRRQIADGMGVGRPLTTADLARLANSIGVDPARVRSDAKRLDRLNDGLSVRQAHVEDIANAIGVSPDNLFFRHPALYSKQAWRKRKATYEEKVREERRVREANLLMHHRVALDRLDLNGGNSIVLLLSLLQRRGVRIEVKPELGDDVWAKHEAGEFREQLQLPPSLPDLRAAIRKLEGAGSGAWFGQYQDRSAIDGGLGPLGPVTAETRTVVVVIVGPLHEKPPKWEVDLSHTVGLGPTFEEQLAEAEDDSSSR